MRQAGVASGTNSALRELGGVFGVAVLASVFAAHGAYSSARAFIAGFTPALWVAVSPSALGILAALLTAGRARVTESPEQADFAGSRTGLQSTAAAAAPESCVGARA